MSNNEECRPFRLWKDNPSKPDPAIILKILIAGFLVVILTGVHIQYRPVIGVQIESNSASLPWLVEPSWVRKWLRWYEIELRAGVYTWGNRNDRAILEISESRNPLLLTIITTPRWARIYPEKRCSPPRPEYLDDFATFVIAAIDRYQPDAIELINEPEVAYNQLDNELDYWIGCWGPHGYYYAEMLKTVYPAVKQAHPEILILAGSLMLEEFQEDFWPDVINTGGVGFYDVVSFHGYSYYPINDFDVALRKAQYLRDIGETAPLWLTETSLLCGYNLPCGSEFEIDQAGYLRYVFTKSNAHDIDMVFWYTLAKNGWQNSDLVAGPEAKKSWYIYRDIVQNHIKRPRPGE